MYFKIGKYTIAASLLPELLVKNTEVFEFTIAKNSVYLEAGKEESLGWVIYYLGVFKSSFAIRVAKPGYIPAWWSDPLAESEEPTRDSEGNVVQLFRGKP